MTDIWFKGQLFLLLIPDNQIKFVQVIIFDLS